MARKHNQDHRDQHDDSPERGDIPTGEEPMTPYDVHELAADAFADDGEQGDEHGAVVPTEEDLESQGFTPDEVRRLVVISDRAAQSAESRAAEAEMRRLRFTRWLIEHGVLDEWSA